MGDKLRRQKFSEQDPLRMLFFCEGCGHPHSVSTNVHKWNGSMDKPSFTPSLLMTWNEPEGAKKCHSYITDGVIDFQSDSTHALAGQKRELLDADVWDEDRNYLE